MKKSFFSKLLAVAAMASLLIAAGCSADSSGGGDSSSEPDAASSTATVSSVSISGSSKIGENGGSYTAVAKGENLDGATITYKWEVLSGGSYVYFADNSANPAALKVESQASEAQAVKIKVTASCGDSSASSDEFSVTLAAKGETVSDEITAVKASASSSSADSGANVTLTAAASANGNPEISYSWEITDGESYGSLSSDSGESVTLTLKNTTSSSQKVTAKVSASDGTNTKEDSVTITVNAASSSGSDEDTTETGSVSVTVNVDGTVTCAKCGKTYDFKSLAENCEHYKCSTCGTVYYSEEDLAACTEHVVVTFKDSDENGNEAVEKTIKSGTTVEAPSWTKAGYKLTWESNVDGVTVDSEITSDVTFTAKWSTTYTVTFKDESGANADVTETVVSGEVVVSVPAWTREHFALSGWTSSVDGLSVNSAVTSDVTFTAVWQEDAKYTVKFVDSEGAIAEQTQTVYEGEKANVPEWTKENYSLSWTSSVEGLTTDSAITSDVTFTASWTEKPKCTNCGTHYDTENAANNCSKQEGCPKYGALTTITFSGTKVASASSDSDSITVAITGNIKSGATIDYDGVTYNPVVKMESSTVITVSGAAGKTVKVVCDTAKAIKYNGSTKVTAIADGTAYVATFTAPDGDSFTINKGDTLNIGVIFIE